VAQKHKGDVLTVEQATITCIKHQEDACGRTLVHWHTSETEIDKYSTTDATGEIRCNRSSPANHLEDFCGQKEIVSELDPRFSTRKLPRYVQFHMYEFV
jgi:hypothetical protein